MIFVYAFIKINAKEKINVDISDNILKLYKSIFGLIIHSENTQGNRNRRVSSFSKEFVQIKVKLIKLI